MHALLFHICLRDFVSFPRASNLCLLLGRVPYPPFFLLLQEGRVAGVPLPRRGAASLQGRRPASPASGSLGPGTWGLWCGGRPGKRWGGLWAVAPLGRPGFCDSDARGIPPRCSRGRDALCACGSHPRGRDRRGPSPSPCPPLFRGQCLSRLKREAPQSGGSSLDSPHRVPTDGP